MWFYSLVAQQACTQGTPSAPSGCLDPFLPAPEATLHCPTQSGPLSPHPTSPSLDTGSLGTGPTSKLEVCNAAGYCALPPGAWATPGHPFLEVSHLDIGCPVQWSWSGGLLPPEHPHVNSCRLESELLLGPACYRFSGSLATLPPSPSARPQPPCDLALSQRGR